MKLGRVIFILVLVCCVIGCSRGSSQSSEALVVALNSEPKTLDPRFATDASGMRIAHHLLFSSLVQLGYDLQIIPQLAEKWEMPQPNQYVFHLRPNVTFHDGSPLTAEDVKFTYDHLMDDGTQSPFAGGYKEKIHSIEIIDPLTVKFTLKTPSAAFLTGIIMPILPKKRVIEDSGQFSNQLIGTGPFQFVSQSPTEIVLKKNADYFDGAPKVEKLVLKVIADDNTRYLKMKKGDIDLAVNVLARDQVDDFSKEPLSKQYNVVESEGITYSYLGFNMGHSLLKDRRIREAIAYAINPQEIITHKLGGHAAVATGMLSPVNWYYEGDVEKYFHDPKKAADILDQTGFRDPDGDGPKKRLTIEFKISNSPEAMAVARVIQAQLESVGIGVDLKSYEWGTFYGDVKNGNFEMTQMAWVGVTEPDFYYDVLHSTMTPPNGRNRGRYKISQLDHLLERGRTTLGAESRKEIYSQVQKLIAHELPYVNLWYSNNIAIVSKRVSGYHQHPNGGFYSFKEISIH